MLTIRSVGTISAIAVFGQRVDLADGVDVQIIGAPSDELRSALAAMAPTIFSPVGT
jgi:hypothetical protein